MLKALISKSCTKCIFHVKSSERNGYVCKKFKEYLEDKDIYKDTLMCYHITDNSIIKCTDSRDDNLSFIINNKMNEDYLSIKEAREYFCGAEGIFFNNKNQ